MLAGGHYADTVQDWVDGLNAFARAEMADYKANTEAYLRTLAMNTASGASDGIVSQAGSAADRIWEAVGGYTHPQPGSRLMQYGENSVLWRLVSPYHDHDYAVIFLSGTGMHPVNYCPDNHLLLWWLLQQAWVGCQTRHPTRPSCTPATFASAACLPLPQRLAL